MKMDQISASAWTSVIDGTQKVQFEFLALQLFVGNLRKRWRAGETTTQDCIRELKEFYAKFGRLPMAERDFNKIADRGQPLTNRLLDLAETARRIAAGQSLMLAGEEALLASLPPGNWIGGTIPYFMTQDGGCLCKDKIFVTEIPDDFPATIHRYSEAELPGIYAAPEGGTVSLVILPADSAVHTAFALHAPHYAGFALHPLIGWIAGIDLATLGQATPKVFCGGPRPLSDAAVVMRITLPDDHLAQIRIINPFQQGKGDTICFPSTGLAATMAVINGEEHNFWEYLQRIKADTRLPLVANYCGAMVNVSLKTLDAPNRRVEFYAPVVSGIEYRLADPVEDYVSEFSSRLQELSPDKVLFSCNCILNYLHSKLEGRRTGALVGPFTFGEIALQLLNQTLVYIEIVEVAPAEPRRADAELSAAMLQLSAAHAELQSSERRFRVLSESVPMGIFLTDAAGSVIYANPGCQKISGVSSEDAAAGGWMQSIHPGDLPGVIAAIKDSERAGRDFDHEFRFVYPDGRTCWAHARATALRSETGETTGQVGTVEDITQRRFSEAEVDRVHQELIKASREAGIAEVATGVLHNVKNVINSINVSAGVIAQQLHASKSSSLAKVTRLLREHTRDLGSFITEDPKGKLLPGYLDQLAEHLAVERTALLEELHQLEKNVQHVKEIVTMEQDLAKLGGTSEPAKPADLMEDALRINAAGLARHGIQVVREFGADVPEITVVKHKVLQILVNFIRNAKEACQATDRPDRKLVLRVRSCGEFVALDVADNGIGISAENRQRIFGHGFTTKEDGHGFGLHSGTRAARDLGGAIEVQSDGPGTGATFTLRLPLCRPAPTRPTQE